MDKKIIEVIYNSFLYLFIDITADTISKILPINIIYAPTYMLYIPQSIAAIIIVYLMYFGFLKYVDTNNNILINSGSNDGIPS